MRILLVYPVPPRAHWPLGDFRSTWVPEGLASVAAALVRAGHAVAVHVREAVLEKNGFDWDAADRQFRALLQEFRPEIVGLSLTTPCVPEGGQLAALVKELCGRHVLVAAGGPHPTALPEQLLEECPSIDVSVVGEGEQTMAELAEKGPGPAVAGIVYRDGDGLVRTPPRPRVHDLDSLGPPPYDLFDMDYFTSRSRWLVRYLPLRATNIRTSRGCTHRCRFCAGHLVGGLGVRFHSIPYVIDQVRGAVDRWNLEAIHFEDDTLGADRGRLLELCEALRQTGMARRIRWDGCLRVDQADPEILASMKAAGCIQVEYGFESGSDDSLRRLGKRSTNEANRRAVRLTREAGLRIFADIMVGLPGETEKDLDATVRFIRWARPEILSATRLHPLPGTPIFDALPPEVRRRLPWGAYAYFDDFGPGLNLTTLTDERYEAWYRRFRKYLSRPQATWAVLRDTPADWRDVRRHLRGSLRRFALRHPIHAARLPR
jgi:anaerobic magnesium-protoporphyrin IX monomethyl ester cyclase